MATQAGPTQCPARDHLWPEIWGREPQRLGGVAQPAGLRAGLGVLPFQVLQLLETKAPL